MIEIDHADVSHINFDVKKWYGSEVKRNAEKFWEFFILFPSLFLCSAVCTSMIPFTRRISATDILIKLVSELLFLISEVEKLQHLSSIRQRSQLVCVSLKLVENISLEL